MTELHLLVIVSGDFTERKSKCKFQIFMKRNSLLFVKWKPYFCVRKLAQILNYLWFFLSYRLQLKYPQELNIPSAGNLYSK